MCVCVCIGDKARGWSWGTDSQRALKETMCSLRRGIYDQLFIGSNTRAIIRPLLLLPADGQPLEEQEKGRGGGTLEKLWTEGVLTEWLQKLSDTPFFSPPAGAYSALIALPFIAIFLCCL